MQEFIHWEWRGFGAVTPEFAERYLALPIHFPQQTVDDLYIWAPGLKTNIKFRTGAEDGLKFKRMEDTHGKFEKWREDPDEIFDLPLNEKQWNVLADDLKGCGILLPAYEPSRCANRSMLQENLQSAGCKLIGVRKSRTARYVHHNDIKVAIEWATISSPVNTLSIGLENVTHDANDEKIITALSQTLDKLDLPQEPLHTKSYLKMLEVWEAFS